MPKRKMKIKPVYQTKDEEKQYLDYHRRAAKKSKSKKYMQLVEKISKKKGWKTMEDK